MLRVAFITHYSNLYGANRSLLNLIDGLGKYDIQPYIICPAKGDIIKEIEKRNIEYKIISSQKWISKLELEFDSNFSKKAYRLAKHKKDIIKRFLYNAKAAFYLKKQLQEWDIDLIYTNSSVIPIGAFVSNLLKMPHIWHLREFVDLDYNFSFDLGKVITKKLINNADAKIAISQSIYDHFIENGSSKSSHIIFNGIAFEDEFDELYGRANSTQKNHDNYTLGLVGAINTAKGQEVAIKALSLVKKRTPNLRLLLVGMGDTSKLEKLVAELGLKNEVEFWGHIDDPYKAYLSADAMLMCSRSEGMGRVTVEAMAACRPVIGFDNAGTSEIIQHGTTGLLYKGNHQELANCISQFIDNPDWAKQLGLNGWHVARQKFSVETYAGKVYEIIRETSRC